MGTIVSASSNSAAGQLSSPAEQEEEEEEEEEEKRRRGRAAPSPSSVLPVCGVRSTHTSRSLLQEMKTLPGRLLVL